jgi:CRISPR-associated endonuclease Csn1
MKINYRLALDLDTHSIGWCVYRIIRDDTADNDHERWRISSIQRVGVRIFSDGRNPTDLASLAASRRMARQTRRRRERALKRKQQLINQLIEYGLMPRDTTERKALTSLDPYELRAKGLNEPLQPHHLGRAIFHLARKRGFRSGRKDLQTEENEKKLGKIQSGIDSLRAKIKNAQCKTVGQYLWRLHKNREPVLARPGANGSYPIYLARELVADEFDQLWKIQQAHHPELLTAHARDVLRDTILFQRKLKLVKPGKCLFERDQDRALLAHPLSQRFRILQELANLRIRSSPSQERSLTLEERNKLLTLLIMGGAAISKGLLSWWEIKTALGLPKSFLFNLDTSGRRGLKADTVSIGLSEEAALGRAWRAWPAEKQGDFLHAIRKANRREELIPCLTEQGFRLEDRQIDGVFRVLGIMPDEFGNISLAALEKIVPALESDVISYSDAVQIAGYSHHSMFYDGEQMNELPYYGQRLPGYVEPRDLPGASAAEREYGRIPNPTVHVGLNQLRKVVNAIIKRYGHPQQIIIEVARELGLSAENRRKLEKAQKENRERNEKYGEELVKRGIRNSRENRQRLQLFEEIANNDPLGAECIYSGERISRTKLFSDEIQIDHILPFSRSLDDGIGNKVLCVRRANRDKGNQTPFAAFNQRANYVWDEIIERAERLVPRKAKRFRENALEEFLKDKDFLARHLNDTAYFSRVAREYLTAICPPNCVWVSTGRLTAMLRGRWNLNRILSDADRKERTDHRRHAVDAAVIGACDRSLIKAMADAARRAEEHGESRLLKELPPPWPTFFDDLKSTVEKIVVSHKPDHSLAGKLHSDTIYGLAEKPDAKGHSLVVRRVSLASIAKRADLTDAVDPLLRNQLLAETENTDWPAFRELLSKFSQRTGVRRVRVAERLSVRAIGNPGRTKSNYVNNYGNYCYEIVRDARGKWQGYVVSLFEANRIEQFDRAMGVHGDPLIMRLHVNDTIATVGKDSRRLFRVARVTDRFVMLAEHFESGNLRIRHADEQDSFRYLFSGAFALKEMQARIAPVDVLGYVNDPGFQE